MMLGASPIALGARLNFMSLHLAFQHATATTAWPLPLPAGRLRNAPLAPQAELEDPQVNFGEVCLVWDHLFGIFHDAPRRPGAGKVGLHGDPIPEQYWHQLRCPFLQ